MAFTSITDSDMKDKGVVGLADTPNLSTTAMQKKFDELATDVIVPKFNNLVSELNGTTASASINVIDPTTSATGTIQATINNLYADAEKRVLKETGKGLSTNDFTEGYLSQVNLNTSLRHTHENKTTLDSISPSVKSEYDNTANKLSTITGVENVVSGGTDKLVTGKAVTDYVGKMGGGDMTRAVYDTDEDGIVDNSEKLNGQEASYYATQSDLANTSTCLTHEQICRILTVGLEDGTTTINGTTITTVASDNRKTITSVSDSTITTVLYSGSNVVIATAVTTITNGIPTTVIS